MEDALPDMYRVGLVQMASSPDPDENLRRAAERVAEAARRGAQVVCLPELFRTVFLPARGPFAVRSGRARAGSHHRAPGRGGPRRRRRRHRQRL